MSLAGTFLKPCSLGHLANMFLCWGAMLSFAFILESFPLGLEMLDISNETFMCRGASSCSGLAPMPCISHLPLLLPWQDGQDLDGWLSRGSWSDRAARHPKLNLTKQALPWDEQVCRQEVMVEGKHSHNPAVQGRGGIAWSPPPSLLVPVGWVMMGTGFCCHTHKGISPCMSLPGSQRMPSQQQEEDYLLGFGAVTAGLAQGWGSAFLLVVSVGDGPWASTFQPSLTLSWGGAPLTSPLSSLALSSHSTKGRRTCTSSKTGVEEQ